MGEEPEVIHWEIKKEEDVYVVYREGKMMARFIRDFLARDYIDQYYDQEQS